MNCPMVICLMLTLSYISKIEVQGCASTGEDCSSTNKCCNSAQTCLYYRANNGDIQRFCKVVKHYTGTLGELQKGATCTDSRQCAQKCCRRFQPGKFLPFWECGPAQFDHQPHLIYRCEATEPYQTY